MRLISFIIVMALAMGGCTPTDVASTRQNNLNAVPVTGTSTSGSGAGATDSTNTSASTLLPKVEIRHLIEPNITTNNYSSGTGYTSGGSYVRKLTLPKNFQGKLYLAGINISSLSDRLVKVRFKFGMNREPITLSAVVAQAPGITPQTNISVLVMDLRSEPFRNVRLSYDLFDYNDYSNSAVTPVQDNRDTGLFCRALRVEDDPTFTGVGECSANDEECLYAYAKVMDQGLVKAVPNGTSTVFVPQTPTLSQVKSISGASYYQDYMSAHLKKPLADNDNGPFKFSELAVPANSTDAINLNFSSGLGIDWTGKTISGSTYFYRGPYRIVNSTEWHFKQDPVGDKRLFKASLSYTGAATGVPVPENNKVYFESYLFPLATQLNLGSGVAHLSSSTWSDPRTETALSVPGKTLWMDGSNARAISKNADLEHVGSCNVTASIEILAKDKNNNEYVVALSKDVKLQLVRPTQYNSDTGNDVLFTNFKTCSTNASCGSSECCFNSRCWDQTLVSQCFDSSNVQGNKQIGESCLTDFDCTSLCCNRTSGLCSPHNTLSSPAVFCSKPIGDFCISKEWCQKTPIVKCLVVKTGTDALGNVTCRQQCYTTMEYGECKSGTCTAPYQEPIPTFDPNASGACDGAVPAPNF